MIQLKEAYEAGNPEDVLYHLEGDPQPNTNPHMQLQLKRGKLSYTFHLNVSVSDIAAPGLPKEYFHWVGVQFTAEEHTIDGTVNACWPLVAVLDTKNQPGRRRVSISSKDVAPMIEAIADQKRKDEEAAKQKEQARLAESNKAKTRNEISRHLGKNNWFCENRALNKLIEGQTIEATTKNRNKIKVKFEGGTVKQVL